jgi:hypothetical protein
MQTQFNTNDQDVAAPQDDELGWHALVKDVTYEMDRCTRR